MKREPKSASQSRSEPAPGESGYRLIRSARRTLEIAVLPGGEVEVRAPLHLSRERIEARLAARRVWIARRRRDLADQPSVEAPKAYRSGETFRYLGRQYRLRVVAGVPRVRLVAGRLEVSAPEPKNRDAIERQVQRWYLRRAKVVLPARVAALLAQPAARGLAPQSIQLRRMRTRWGSCSSSGGRILLNTELVRLPTALIDFVIAHELTHLRVQRHGAAFDRRLASLVPEWQSCTARLMSVSGHPSQF